MKISVARFLFNHRGIIEKDWQKLSDFFCLIFLIFTFIAGVYFTFYAQRCLKNVFLEISQNLQEKTSIEHLLWLLLLLLLFFFT